MDKLQLEEFLDLLVGWRSLGVAGDEEIAEPRSPELRTFIIARLGVETPSSGRNVVRGRQLGRPLAALLREVADGIDPPSMTGDTAHG